MQNYPCGSFRRTVLSQLQNTQLQSAAPLSRRIAPSEIREALTLENSGDRECFLHGDADAADIRQATVNGLVDTGAVTLVPPPDSSPASRTLGRVGLPPR